MFIWRRIRFASLASLLFAVLVVPLMTATPARAGANILTAEGGVIDDNGDTGHIVLGGLVNLDRSGGAKALDITIAYQDNRVSSGLPNHDSFVCKLTDPSDLSYAVSNGVGTATFTVASDDTCFQTANPSSTFSNSGNSISFQAYVIGSKVRMVSTASTLVDGAGDEVPNMAVSGELDPSGAGSAQVAGNRLVSGGGGAIDADDLYSGHLALAGLVELTTVTKNHALGNLFDGERAVDNDVIEGSSRVSNCALIGAHFENIFGRSSPLRHEILAGLWSLPFPLGEKPAGAQPLGKPG